MPKESGLPKGVSEFRDRHGRARLRYRRKGLLTYYFKAAPFTQEFWDEYAACLDRAGPTVEERRAAKVAGMKPGSISALIAAWYSMPEFTGLAESTQATYRGILERFRLEFGDLLVKDMTRQRVKAILGTMSDTPSAANNLLDRLRVLMRLALDEEWITIDPTYRVKGFRIDSDGFHTWTEAEIETFCKRHPAGSKPRLALMLMLCTAQRRSDVVTIGRQRIEADRIKLRQKKTGEWVSVPIHPDLRKELRMAPKANMTFLLTEYGRPFSPAGFGNWFRTQCDLAGLPQCSAHGLRKAAARRLAEAGATHEEIKSITGHRTDKEVSRYVAEASQLKLSAQAMKKITRPKRERNVG